MKNEFRGFSKEAQLFAENLEVVEEMRNKFVEDVSDFLDALRDRMRSHAKEGFAVEEERERKAKNCVWFGSDAEINNDDDVLYVWFPLNKNNAKIVTPGILELEVSANGAIEDFESQIPDFVSGIKLADNCKSKDGKVIVTYGMGDPVEAAWEPILNLLTILNEKTKILWKEKRKTQ